VLVGVPHDSEVMPIPIDDGPIYDSTEELAVPGYHPVLSEASQTEPAQQGVPAQPGEPAQQGEPAQHGEPVQQGEPAKQGEPDQQGEPEP
jgi:hypothetical protein